MNAPTSQSPKPLPASLEKIDVMIQSQYILDISDLTFDDHKASDLLRKQVDFLTITETEHTGIGLFIKFSADPGVKDYKANENY